MAFNFTPSANPMAIAELEYATGATIQFTAISSCVALIGQVNGGVEVFGVHIPLLTAQNQMFAPTDVAAVSTILGNLNANLATVWVIGQLSVWEASNPVGYLALTTAWPTAYQFAQGVYMVTMVDGAIDVQIRSATTIRAAPAAAPPSPGAGQQAVGFGQAQGLEQAAEANSQLAAEAAQVQAEEVGAEIGSSSIGPPMSAPAIALTPAEQNYLLMQRGQAAAQASQVLANESEQRARESEQSADRETGALDYE